MSGLTNIYETTVEERQENLPACNETPASHHFRINATTRAECRWFSCTCIIRVPCGSRRSGKSIPRGFLYIFVIHTVQRFARWMTGVLMEYMRSQNMQLAVILKRFADLLE